MRRRKLECLFIGVLRTREHILYQRVYIIRVGLCRPTINLQCRSPPLLHLNSNVVDPDSHRAINVVDPDSHRAINVVDPDSHRAINVVDPDSHRATSFWVAGSASELKAGSESACKVNR
jgi:hypothetical protein